MMLLLAFFASATTLRAQQMPPIPVDKEVRVGRLENGLTYYIRANKRPENRANFYIVQRVGSILEEENQRGLAHFLEHMAFNGSKNFPAGDDGKNMISYLETIGVKFGANLNAYTSMDETVYNINDVPTTTAGAVDSCLLILYDWSNTLLLREKEIDKERKVIHEEWRTRRNASQRMIDSIAPAIFKDSKYAHRMPIGLMSVVDHFEPQALRDYYHKWYRP
ncbi:MAG: M16 family metallopeptidase, partial [Tannerella forsythia]